MDLAALASAGRGASKRRRDPVGRGELERVGLRRDGPCEMTRLLARRLGGMAPDGGAATTEATPEGELR